MTNNPLELQPFVSAKKMWRRWKWIGLALFAAVLIFGRWLPGLIVFFGYLYGIVVIANLLFLTFLYLKNRFFWRVRNRLIGAFIFVGVIPILLLFGIVAASGYVLFGQLAGRYLENSLQEIQHQLTAINTEMAARASTSMSESAFGELASRTFAEHAGQFSHLAARLLRKNAAGAWEVAASTDPRQSKEDAKSIPEATWLGEARTYEGLVRNEQIALMVSLQPVPRLPGIYLSVSAPLDRFIEDRIQREKSIYFSLIGTGHTKVLVRNGSVQVSVDDQPTAEAKMDEADLSGLISRRDSDPRRKVTWVFVPDCKEYGTGKQDRAGMALLYVPFETVYRYSVGGGDIQNKVLVAVIYFLGGMFIFVEIISLITGFTISRRITRSVHDMYQGTLALQRGELGHKIPVRRQDQLGLLAHSFNQMSASIVRLLEEVSEKKRLEQELEIAREVQATLFPKQLPHPRGMAIFGGCEPARVVSGDYYDFIVEDEARLDIVVADISGKGISAALLMANLQAAMRNQLLSIKHDGPDDIGKSLAGVMTQLNEQIYRNSPAEKYATLFLARYDAVTRRLWYCNAGHLPPILMIGEETRFLEATGMVVGLLPQAPYQAGSVDLVPGSLLAIFTDGVTEAVNKEDEEFGDQRLLSALKEARTRTPEGVYQFVIDKIRTWQGELPQHDDITLIVAKAV
jgi:sigma-B regulation protein RsbU (phosphoserine phosphatase)